MTAAVNKALHERQDEKEEWMGKMCQNVKKFDIYWWMDLFLGAVDG